MDAVPSPSGRVLGGVEPTGTHTDAAAPVAVEDRPRHDVPCASAASGVGTAVPPVAHLPAVLRPYRHAHAHDVRRIWRATLAMGSPVPFPLAEVATYESLALDWYLDPDNHAARRADAVVVEEDGVVRGYLLACLDEAHFQRWATRRAVRWATGAVLRLPRMSSDARRFVRLRVRDGLHAWRHQVAPPFPAHMHFNLDPQLRGVGIGHHLVGWMDRRVEAAGLAGYVGEVNVPHGGSLRAIEAAGAEVVDRVANRTFSWLLGTPVERCVIARPLARRTTTVPR